MTNWIKCTDQLPMLEGEYLCVVKKHGVRIRKYYPWCKDHLRWWSNGVEAKNITHWMPLPSLPNERSITLKLGTYEFDSKTGFTKVEI